MRVQLRCSEVADSTVATRSGMVADEDVKVVELRNRPIYQALWSTVFREVYRSVDDSLGGVTSLPSDLTDQRCDVVTTPRLLDIMRSMVSQQKVSPSLGESRRDRKPIPCRRLTPVTRATLPLSGPSIMPSAAARWHRLAPGERAARSEARNGSEGSSRTQPRSRSTWPTAQRCRQ